MTDFKPLKNDSMRIKNTSKIFYQLFVKPIFILYPSYSWILHPFRTPMSAMQINKSETQTDMSNN